METFRECDRLNTFYYHLQITRDPYFVEGMGELISKHHYDVNLINLKITLANDINYSDDNLTFLPYFTYIWTTLLSGENPLGEYFDRSIVRTFDNVKRVKSALWNVVFMIYLKHLAPEHIRTSRDWSFVMRDAAWQLETLPVGTNQSII